MIAPVRHTEPGQNTIPQTKAQVVAAMQSGWNNGLRIRVTSRGTVEVRKGSSKGVWIVEWKNWTSETQLVTENSTSAPPLVSPHSLSVFTVRMTTQDGPRWEITREDVTP